LGIVALAFFLAIKVLLPEVEEEKWLFLRAS